MARWWAAGLALAMAACGEMAGPRGSTATLSIVPVFDAAGAFADNADQLRIIIKRVSTPDTVTIKDTVLSIDTTGTASGNLSVVIVSSPQEFLVTLSAVRSSDNVVLFSGTTSVSVSSAGGGTAPPPVLIPVSYSGPKGTALVIAPRDTVVTAGATFVLRAAVFGTSGPVAAPVTFSLVTPADSTTLKVNHLTGVAVAAAGAAGTVKVYAASPDILRDTTTVTVGSVSAPVASVAVTPATATIAVGGTQQLAAALKDAAGNALNGRTITWTSADATIATVGSSTGLVTGVAAGTVVVTATSEGKTGTATITVSPVPVASVTVTPAAPTLAIGATQQMTATLRDAANNVLTGRTITWSSSLPGVASVNAATGLVTAIAGGQATITATSGGVSGTTTVTVLPPVATVTVTPGIGTLPAGATTTLTATLKDAGGNVLTGRTITWASSLPGVASVNAATGLITCIAAGQTTITATSEGKFGTAIQIVVVPASVKVTPGFVSVAAGSTTALTGVVFDNLGVSMGGLAVTFTSKTPSVATVNAATGLVTGVAVGSTVVVGTNSGFSDSTLIVVPPTGNVVASTTAGLGRTYQVHKVGDTVTVVLTADMTFTPSEKLGSYGDTLSWNPAVLQFIDVQGGPVFASPTSNTTNVAAGQLRMVGADPSSNTVGQVVIAKVRFKALATGAAALTLGFDEMSGQGPAFTHLYQAGVTNRITVANGKVTVIP